ncbi:MAG: RsbRD N-terminal domain-containing protein [Acidobacteriota bacterium]
MNAEAEIAERWLEKTLASYPAKVQPFIAAEQDPFRNPVGNTLRRSLATLVHESLGAMDPQALAAAVDELIRIRAVQDFTPREALRFLFHLRSAAASAAVELPADFDARVDEIALLAFDNYMACREQIFNLRTKELRLRMQSTIMEGIQE